MSKISRWGMEENQSTTFWNWTNSVSTIFKYVSVRTILFRWGDIYLMVKCSQWYSRWKYSLYLYCQHFKEYWAVCVSCHTKFLLKIYMFRCNMQDFLQFSKAADCKVWWISKRYLRSHLKSRFILICRNFSSNYASQINTEFCNCRILWCLSMKVVKFLKCS